MSADQNAVPHRLARWRAGRIHDVLVIRTGNIVDGQRARRIRGGVAMLYSDLLDNVGDGPLNQPATAPCGECELEAETPSDCTTQSVDRWEDAELQAGPKSSHGLCICHLHSACQDMRPADVRLGLFERSGCRFDILRKGRQAFIDACDFNRASRNEKHVPDAWGQAAAMVGGCHEWYK